eukprot:351867-Chlamydomonas_euryale.AAC.1
MSSISPTVQGSQQNQRGAKTWLVELMKKAFNTRPPAALFRDKAASLLELSLLSVGGTEARAATATASAAPKAAMRVAPRAARRRAPGTCARSQGRSAPT